MSHGKLTRYSASAGSGKTYVLTGEFLKFLFSNRYNYRKILAVTFTNRAAAEMKERILSSLHDISLGKASDYINDLSKQSGKEEDWIRNEAGVILKNILHDYSMFSVGTIDSFFQKVLRSFTRESGLHTGFNLILDHSSVLSESYDKLLNDIEDNPLLLKWLIDFSKHELEEGDDWNLRRKILGLGEELFKEVFRILTSNNRIVTDKETISDTLDILNSLTVDFKEEAFRLAGECIALIDMYSLTESDFLGGSRGLVPFLGSFGNNIPEKINSYVAKSIETDQWSKQGHNPENLSACLEDGLTEKVRGLVDYYGSNIRGYRTAEEILRNIYSMGIISDLSERVRQLVADENKFLLSDAGDFINQIIGEDQTPFIYEKIGIRYSNFMIDEFQDTSKIQWNNFSTLIENSLAEGEDNLVVGDAKQSIYRWRNSDWRIFSDLHTSYNEELFENRKLLKNWRSCPNIIRFNNWLFTSLPDQIKDQVTNSDTLNLDAVYSDVIQEDPGSKKDGYIRIETVQYAENEHQSDMVLNRLPILIEEIQDNGYSPEEIAILVRRKDEGKRIIERLMEYSITVEDQKREKYSYQVISQDSLFLYLSPAINLIIAALKYMIDPCDVLNKANLIYSCLQSTTGEEIIERALLLDLNMNQEIEKDLPKGYTELFSRIIQLPLFEIVEEIIEFFGLHKYQANIPFITTFQDLVLGFSGSESNDIPSFISWWDSEGQKSSVSSSDQEGALNLMTIHKSKGLQFKVVIIPFLDWRFSSERGPLIWVSSEEDPFSKIGSVPVRFRKQLEQTYFADSYYQEKDQQLLDNINLLYVAFTRAEECLYGFIPQGNRTRKDAGHYMINCFEESRSEHGLLNAADFWNREKGLFEYGNVPGKQEVRKREKSSILDIGYLTGKVKSRLILKLNGREAVSIMDDYRREQIGYGIMMHDIFAGINTKEDIDKALRKMIAKGLIIPSNVEPVRNNLEYLLGQEKIREWFSEEGRVVKEAGILLDSGETRRPDRVIFFDDRVEVIDFKFGSENDTNRRQVKEYVEILSRMGNDNVIGYLWYVNLNKIVEVMKG